MLMRGGRRCGARGLEQKPRDRRRTRRRSLDQLRPARSCCTCFICAPGISRPLCTTQSAAPPSPEPSMSGRLAALAHSILGISLQVGGDLGGARMELEAALRREARSRRSTTIYLGFDGKSLAGAILARNLWLQGHPAQAVERARRTIKDAAAMDHSLTLSIVLIWGISVFLWTGDLQSAEEHTDWLISRSESHSLAPYRAAGRGFKGELAIRRGDAKRGVGNLRGCLENAPLNALRVADHTAQHLARPGSRGDRPVRRRHRADRRDHRAGREKWGYPIHARVTASEGKPSSVAAAAMCRRRGNVLQALA